MSKKLITLLVCLISTTLVFGQKDSLSKRNNTIKKLVEIPTSLEDVIVTANKVEQKQNTTGKILTIINAAQIQANAGRSIAQILNEQAGLNVPGALSNAGTVPSIYMRGAASGRTLILIDGVPVGDPSMINNEFDLNLVPLDQVERIEILKGAQSTLYGSDAIGGVINIITKAKNKKSWAGNYSAGSYGTQKLDVQHAGNFSKLNYILGIQNQSADGFSSATDKNNTGKFDNDGYQNKSWFANLNYLINQQWSIKGYTKKTDYSADIDYGTFKDDKDQKFNTSTRMSGIFIGYKKGKTNFQLKYQLNTQERVYNNDSVDKTYTIFEHNEYIGKSHFADAFLTTPISKNILWSIGSDFRYGAYRQTYASISKWGPYNDLFKDTFQYQNSIYSSFIINDNNQKWILEIGSRYNKPSRYANHSTFTISPSYQLNVTTRLMASVSTGFKSPSLYQLSYNDALKSESSFNAEMGVEYKKNNLFARAVYYNRTIDNGIDYNYIDYNYFNYIKQKVNGVELELNWKANAKNTFSANYTLMNGQEINQNRVTTKDTITYNYLLKRPKHSAGIQWNYIASTKLNFSLAARYVSDRYDVGGYATKDVILKNYLIINAHTQYQLNKRFTLFADGQNLGNVTFQEINGYNAIGRMLMIGIRFN